MSDYEEEKQPEERREKKKKQRNLRCSSCNRLLEHKDDVYEVPGAYILSERKWAKICHACAMNPVREKPMMP
jgi:hypothetical protein